MTTMRTVTVAGHAPIASTRRYPTDSADGSGAVGGVSDVGHHVGPLPLRGVGCMGWGARRPARTIVRSEMTYVPS